MDDETDDNGIAFCEGVINGLMIEGTVVLVILLIASVVVNLHAIAAVLP